MTTRTHGNGWEHGAIPFEALVKALEFDSPETRLRAAQSLGVRGQQEAVEPILKCLTRPEENPLVRSALYLALGKLGDRRAIPVLTDCIGKETREELRSDCATAFGMRRFFFSCSKQCGGCAWLFFSGFSGADPCRIGDR
ncbi:MAG: HEAT repeat domain-containing protein [Planctomycetota bacterium]